MAMPLLDHFHAPLKGTRHWEGFHHAWATNIAQHLNRGVLPEGYFAEAEISLGPTLEIDVANFEEKNGTEASARTSTLVWAPPRPTLSFPVSFARLEVCEVRVYEELGGPQLRAAIELVSPGNKDRPASRRTFAAKCGGYLKQALGLVVVDAVTERIANLHAEVMETLEVSGEPWVSPTDLYAVAYHPVPVQKQTRVDVWPEVLTVGSPLPVLPLWLGPELCLPLQLEETYRTTCEGLRIRG
jgi:hypothetical protein